VQPREVPSADKRLRCSISVKAGAEMKYIKSLTNIIVFFGFVAMPYPVAGRTAPIADSFKMALEEAPVASQRITKQQAILKTYKTLLDSMTALKKNLRREMNPSFTFTRIKNTPMPLELYQASGLISAKDISIPPKMILFQNDRPLVYGLNHPLEDQQRTVGFNGIMGCLLDEGKIPAHKCSDLTQDFIRPILTQRKWCKNYKTLQYVFGRAVSFLTIVANHAITAQAIVPENTSALRMLKKWYNEKNETNLNIKWSTDEWNDKSLLKPLKVKTHPTGLQVSGFVSVYDGNESKLFEVDFNVSPYSLFYTQKLVGQASLKKTN
jgi:hypothetical protein